MKTKLNRQKSVAEYSILGLIALGFKEFFGFLASVLKSGDESDLLREIGVKKGFWAGVKYVIFMFFVLIPKVLRYAINPTKKFKNGVEKLTNNIIAFFALREEDYLSETYSNFIAQLLEKSDVTLKANIEDVNKFVNMYILRNILNLFVFVFLVELIIEVGSGYVAIVLGNAGYFTALTSFLDMGIDEIGFLNMLFAATGVLLIMFATIIAFIAFAYLTFFMLKLIWFEFKNILRINEKELEEFLDDLIVFNYVKAKELYGDVADSALLALKQNFVFKDKELEKIEYLNVKKIEQKV